MYIQTLMLFTALSNLPFRCLDEIIQHLSKLTLLGPLGLLGPTEQPFGCLDEFILLFYDLSTHQLQLFLLVVRLALLNFSGSIKLATWLHFRRGRRSK